MFSRALGSLLFFILSCHWLLRTFSFVLIGRSNYFGFDFTTFNREAFVLFLVYYGIPTMKLMNTGSLIYALLTKRGVKMVGYWPSLSLRSYGPRGSQGLKKKIKKKNRMKLTYNNLDRSSFVNIYLLYSEKVIALSRIKACLFQEMEKLSSCFSSKINPREPLMFCLFWLSSAAFCDSIVGIVQNL